MSTPTADELDYATIKLIFALRDSLTQDGPSRLDFWNTRVTTAIETAAAGSSTAGQAITTAARKLQIPALGKDPSAHAADAAAIIDQDYAAWARHIAQNIVYIVALARIENTELQAAKTALKETR
ncbi:hypothetical protein [Corynebacterium liangguodongii]|uniref:Uncharacterized protein n=1 Tax=Corynebacterium liangguodongii TaxID=2079535 RepID=A0A2S0WG96_9CORY|nr:hypothetical protein [Corynebacterium liangguodongii]AWB84797.1 hypothetical protein C3E79_10190 [Corynebacterium liangguodongii]PWB99154.1 hypothetical protein DF219_07805 [Corynebacterium liangguodongii]